VRMMPVFPGHPFCNVGMSNKCGHGGLTLKIDGVSLTAELRVESYLGYCP
jgi:hypothetical protein